jgi:predicted esterase
MYDVLASGKESFKIEVPYKLIETGKKGINKPLIVYLHGYNQNIKRFENKITDFFQLQAYHLLIQGPYPIYDTGGNRKVPDWGRAWYLYDGNRGQFIKSLEVSAEFIQQVLDRHLQLINANRICIFGYSMGGYLAGYFALTRWKHINELIVAGCRIKTEVLNNEWDKISHMNVLALHGEKDDSVKAKSQKVEIEKLQKHGVSATFKSINEKHKLTNAFISEANHWLTTMGYKEIDKS